MELKEDLLYHIWQHRLFEAPLLDLDEKMVELVDPGLLNRDAGPDFFNARIRSEGILWVGNIEIHRKASEWYQHKHHLDQAFDNVILHVVLDTDCQIANSKGRVIRTVKMQIPPNLRMRYELLMETPAFIPCWKEIDRIEKEPMNLWLERLFVERLEQRLNWVIEVHAKFKGDWNEVLYLSMARAFGQKVNADPFEILARSVSFKRIQEFCEDLISKEALLFGMAGLLDETENKQLCENGLQGGESPRDPYYSELCARFTCLRNKMEIHPMDTFLWKFLRLRPDNFPTIRISQLAFSLDKHPELFSELIGQTDPVDFILKMEIRASEYWNSHYRFGRLSPEREKNIGKTHLSGLYINSFLPVMLAYYRLNLTSPRGWNSF